MPDSIEMKVTYMDKGTQKETFEQSVTSNDITEQNLDKRGMAEKLFTDVELKINEIRDLGINITRPCKLLEKARNELQKIEENTDCDMIIKELQLAYKIIE